MFGQSVLILGALPKKVTEVMEYGLWFVIAGFFCVGMVTVGYAVMQKQKGQSEGTSGVFWGLCLALVPALLIGVFEVAGLWTKMGINLI